MCTAVTFHGRDGFYMGRTLDYERSFGEQVVVTPRRFPLRFRHGETLEEHYALVGMAHVAEGWPLYYDAVNEMGLGMAGGAWRGCCSRKAGGAARRGRAGGTPRPSS